MNYVRELVLALLVLLFAYAGVSKLWEGVEFERQLAAQPLPDWSKPPLRYGLPLLELVIAGGLLSRATRGAALVGYTLLMALLTGYIGLGLLGAFPQMPCSCGGILRGMGWKPHFYLNLFFLALAFTSLRWHYQQNP